MASVFNDYYSHENHGPFELFDLGNFPLEEGGALHDGQLAYTTQGTLSAQKDNAILLPTWYSGTSKIMADVHVGQGRPSTRTSISSLSPTNSAMVCPVRRPIRPPRSIWRVSRGYGSATTSTLSTSW